MYLLTDHVMFLFEEFDWWNALSMMIIRTSITVPGGFIGVEMGPKWGTKQANIVLFFNTVR